MFSNVKSVRAGCLYCGYHAAPFRRAFLCPDDIIYALVAQLDRATPS